MLMADVMLGAVLDGADENLHSNAADAPAKDLDEDFEGASLVILVRPRPPPPPLDPPQRMHACTLPNPRLDEREP